MRDQKLNNDNFTLNAFPNGKVCWDNYHRMILSKISIFKKITRERFEHGPRCLIVQTTTPYHYIRVTFTRVRFMSEMPNEINIWAWKY